MLQEIKGSPWGSPSQPSLSHRLHCARNAATFVVVLTLCLATKVPYKSKPSAVPRVPSESRITSPPNFNQIQLNLFFLHADAGSLLAQVSTSGSEPVFDCSSLSIEKLYVLACQHDRVSLVIARAARTHTQQTDAGGMETRPIYRIPFCSIPMILSSGILPRPENAKSALEPILAGWTLIFNVDVTECTMIPRILFLPI